MNAHSAMHAVRNLMKKHRFSGSDVAHILVEGHRVLSSHHNILEPTDISKGQYSVPFCVALTLFRNPADPSSFDASAITDPKIRNASKKVEIRIVEPARPSAKYTRVTIDLTGGRQYVGECETFKGLPADPLTREELRRKFMFLTTDLGDREASRLYDRLEHLESLPTFSLR